MVLCGGKTSVYFLGDTWVNTDHTKENTSQGQTIRSAKVAFLKGLQTRPKKFFGKWFQKELPNLDSVFL